MAQMAILPALMAGLSLAGTAVSTVGAIRQGQAQQQAAEFEARQMDVSAKAVEAAGQHAALERRRQSELLQSRAQAVAGASGFGAVDPDVLKIIGGITEEGERSFQTELYNAQQQAMGIRNQAVATRFEGQEARRGGQIRAVSTALSGAADAGSIYAFGQSQPFGAVDVFRSGGRSTGME